jgi:hypothetical protein
MVELTGLDSRDHPLAHRRQHLVDDPVRLIHQVDLAQGLEHRRHQAPPSASTPNRSNIRAVTSSTGRLPSISRSRPRSL